ncbi:hypothetical protein J4434_01080 [Candidatus Woesearchaeota archaeon]|nr:hypothetical protein [Candidatus Woesearchaeota archaeon]
MVKDKKMIKDKSITDKIKKVLVGTLAGASMFVGGEAIAQQHQQGAQEIQDETQQSFFSKQEKEFNTASYNLGVYMLWKDVNKNGKVETSELVNVPNDINSDPKLLENAVSLTEQGVKLAPSLKPHNQDYIKKIRSKVKSAEEAYKKNSSEENKQHLRKTLRDLDQTFRQWAKHNIDFSILPEAYQKVAWNLLYKVTPFVEKVFLAQRDPNNLKYRIDLIKKGELEDYLHLNISGGVWCLTVKDDLCSSHPDFPKKVPNAGQWPSGFTQEDINRIKSSPNDPIMSHFVNVVWSGNGSLTWDSINNSPYYKDELRRLSKELEELVKIIGIDTSLSNYFLIRANEFLDLKNPSPYQSGDLLWIKQKSLLDVLVGNNEEYHGAFERIGMMEMNIGIINESYTKVGQTLQQLIQPTENKISVNLGEGYAIRDFTKFQPPLVFADTIYSGDSRSGGYVGGAKKFPNIEPFGRTEFYKNVIALNNITARMDLVSLPMAKVVMDQKQLADLIGEDSIIWVVAHEMAHGLGPSNSYIISKLGEYAHALEEAKADLLGMAILGQAVRQNLISEEEWKNALISIIPSYLRGLSYGVDDPHGTGSILQFAELYKAGVIVETPEGKYKIDLDNPQIYDAFYETALKIMTIQQEGDYKSAKNWIKESQEQLPKLLQEKHIPVIGEMPRDVYLWYSFKFSPNVEREMMGEMQKEMTKGN